ncbi:hypothetical protein [Polaromonas sp.]|uniref:hypothetical protein n=1 Tax=Polaromonas sp. TaxID=1869339 RepID=UPI0024875608|nr:hypothetical protein [Polaromonas sp.]MDI1273093.1 hypothetical protein [Polaromonas sp.]
MSQQLALTIAAAAIGFVAAVYFCVGNVMNTPTAIVAQATPRWDFSEPLARTFAAQRAQYVVGAILLVVAFMLQVAAALASSTSALPLPAMLQSWPAFLISVLLLVGGVSSIGALFLHKSTLEKVLALGMTAQDGSAA